MSPGFALVMMVPWTRMVATMDGARLVPMVLWNLLAPMAQGPLPAQPPAPVLSADLLAQEKQRIEIIRKIAPATVAVVSGGGSGVLISDDGYALSNFHVVAGGGAALRCGLPDGKMYDAVLIGLDKMGDLALIKLLPPTPDFKFPFSVLGDSDLVKTGDWAVALGNPFLLATDFSPTVTFGLVSGTHRYQYPERGMYEYADCIQMDASINPGNSGGPLYNMAGELIGINGRGSFDKRGRVNSGIGYAISANQIKNFLGNLRSGLLAEHAGLGALVSTVEDSTIARILVTQVAPGDAQRRGLMPEDQIIQFAGRPVSSVNQFKNILGTLPAGWKVPLSVRRVTEMGETRRLDMLVRLASGERPEPPPAKEGGANPEGRPRPPGAPPEKPLPAEVKKLYEAKKGFANYHFNKTARDRALKKINEQFKLKDAKGEWALKGTGTFQEKNAQSVWQFSLIPGIAAVDDKPAVLDRVVVILDGIDFSLEPLKLDVSAQVLKDPPGSGGLLVALFHLRQLLTQLEAGFPGDGCQHGGTEPYWPPAEPGQPLDQRKPRMAEVLKTSLGGVQGRWYLDLTTGALLAVEVTPEAGEDPCEIHFSQPSLDPQGRSLPRDWIIAQGDRVFARLKVQDWTIKP